MKILINLILSCMIFFSGCKKSSTSPSEPIEEEWLYTLTGEGLIIDAEAKTMTIVHTDEDLVAFTDRPVRKTYHSTPQWIADYWNRGDDSLSSMKKIIGLEPSIVGACCGSSPEHILGLYNLQYEFSK